MKATVTCGGDWNDGGDGDSALPEMGNGGQNIVIGMCNSLNVPEIEEKGPEVSESIQPHRTKEP